MKRKNVIFLFILSFSLVVSADSMVTRVKSVEDTLDEEIEKSGINFSEIEKMEDKSDDSSCEGPSEEDFLEYSLDSDEKQLYI